MKLKVYLSLPALAMLALSSCATSSNPTVASSSNDAYYRQESLDNRLPQPITTDQSSPLKDVRLKPGAVGINTMTF